jgi:hypothetical protein
MPALQAQGKATARAVARGILRDFAWLSSIVASA